MQEIKIRYYFQHETGNIWHIDYTLEQIEKGIDVESRHSKQLIDKCLFIGLKDRNGKEIFEGDIVKHPLCVKESHDVNELCECEHFIGRIQFEVDRGQYFAVNMKQNGYVIEMSQAFKFEIVGNVYENPELLKGESK